MESFNFGNPNDYGDFPYLYVGKWNKDNLNAILLERLPESYDMQLVDQTEVTVLSDVVNMGIDSHLEACTLSKKDHLVPIEIGGKVYGNKYGIGFDKTGMICLIRRLMEYNPHDHWDFTGCEPSQECKEESQEERELWEASYHLVSSILETLQIEYMG